MALKLAATVARLKALVASAGGDTWTVGEFYEPAWRLDRAGQQ